MRSLSKIIKNLPLILNLIALLAAVWIIVPAPATFVWLLSVAASEWSLWLGIIAVVNIFFTLLIRFFAGEKTFRFAPLIVGIVVLIISLYPLFSVLPLARKQGVSLSFARYFSAVWKRKDAAENFSTYTFAQAAGKDLQLDVYLPTNETANRGASIIVVHGGSWRGGARNDFPQWNQWLAAQGFTVFDVDYRLAQPNYLTATGDVKCAVRWVKTHAAEFKISTDRIALLGRSAGAHLALLAAYSADDARLPATCAENNSSETVRAVVSFYAPTDLIWAYDNPANQLVIDGPQTLADFLGGSPYQSDEMRERYIFASPVSRVGNQTPPSLLIHGGRDQLVRSENMTLLNGKLNEANVPRETIFIPYAQHGFDYNFNGWGAQIAEAAILNFLRENTGEAVGRKQ